MPTSVAVLRDFSYDERPGEEELAIQRFLRAVPDHIALRVIPPGVSMADEDIADADVVVSFGLKRYPDRVFDLLLDHPRHVHFSQDWWEPVQPQSVWRDRIVRQAHKVVFMSALHKERYLRLYRLDDVRHTAVLPFPVLASDIQPQELKTEKQDAALWCAPWHPDNGSDIMIRWADREKQRVHAYGLGVPVGEIAPHVEGIGKVALDAAAPTFRQYEQFVFFPRTPAPFGFPILLAFALGLEVKWSNEIGSLSADPSRTPDVLSMRNMLDSSFHAIPEFWNIVEAAA